MSSKTIQRKTTEDFISRCGERHEGTEVRYTYCNSNGCWEGCLLECQVRDGELISVDVGDPVNANMPREDVGDKALHEGLIQHRPCVRGRLWRKTQSSTNRLLHPMRNIGKKGDPVWEQISWEEALDTIADKLKETVAEYGPLSVRNFGFPVDFGPYAGFGLMEWGLCSWAGHHLADATVLGYQDLIFYSPNPVMTGTEPLDLLNSKLIVGLGWNPAINRPEYAHALALAKEKGIPIIIVDSRCTPTVQTFADQWIPIRTGTDLSLLMAIANVLFKEDLIDHGFVDSFVEPEGLARWRQHVLGEDDGIDKTPEWAESICAVPAETIRGLARLYGSHHGYSDGNACYFKAHWSLARTAQGENIARVGIYLQALTGNIGVPGGNSGGADSFIPPAMPTPMVNRGSAMPSYAPPFTHTNKSWMDAVLLRDDLDSGKITEQEYRRIIGCAADWPLPNIRFMYNHQGVNVGTHDSHKYHEAMKKLDFVVSPLHHMDRPEAMYSDIILPLADSHLEDVNDVNNFGGFLTPCAIGPGTYSNYFIMKQKVLDPPGEAKPLLWINCQIAKRLGVLEQYQPRLADVLDDDEAWDARNVEFQREAYENWRVLYGQFAEMTGAAVKETPTWEEFCKKPIFRIPLEREPWYGWKPQVKEGVPFGTPSGKIEFFSDFLASPEMPDEEFTFASGEKSTMCFGGSSPAVIKPFADYIEAWDGPFGEMAERYPMRLITPHSFFRTHICHDNNTWMPDEARHAVWISVADARDRGIEDGDVVRVFNPQGEVVLPAYVTSRIAPRTICIIYGAWYRPGTEKTELMPEGIDMRGSANNLTSSKTYPWVVGNLHCAHQAQVELCGR